MHLNGLKPKMMIYGTEEIYDYFIESIIEIVKFKNANENENISEKMEIFKRMVLQDLQRIS